MSARRGFGDETWRLALEGDSEALRRAAEMLLGDAEEPGGELYYEGRRARAFALAVEGRREEALEELHRGWTEEWPLPAAYATDVARVGLLAGDHASALNGLRLSVRGADRLDYAVPEVAAECVRRSRRLCLQALRLASARGTPSQRARLAGRVLRARFS